MSKAGQPISIDDAECAGGCEEHHLYCKCNPNKQITEIECTFETHFSFRTDDLDVDWSKVVDWYVKKSHLHYELEDGTRGEEYLGNATDAYDNVDLDRPTNTMICVPRKDGIGEMWINRKELPEGEDNGQ